MKEHKPVSVVPDDKEPANVRQNENFRMPETKPAGEDADSRKLLRLTAVSKPPRANSTMQTDMPTRIHNRRTKGRLNRETMVKLGKVLGDYFDHVRQQDMPDRITEVLSQFEKANDKGSN